ncbi:hypothetical protein D8674_012126 [Pyrus ussuriensis x Pyrus communis]|uniref:Uncharacterized protein n=1 Tax=Pyrus ussuriensis x Pyrus communis TaxID=2448454 RepID=A0A5N5G0M7_9ROSA|nr:hypothetical protein D8674_012126 [Pyrus ussuriensis x Pyrus communis]
MNSMFSSFDALCAEFLGQRVKSSFPTQQLKSTAAVPSNNTISTAKQEGNMESLPEAKKQSRRSPPRFAVELDGLNCFETLVS